ncbi:MAG: hypothetical protein H7833_06615 [Magnetococcus sp. DMHC-1]|nr:hypothetical protein [Magnetococcales bacterium]
MKHVTQVLLGFCSFFLMSQNLLAADMVEVGGVTKKSSGMLISAISGDVACYLEMKDSTGKTFTEMAVFEICDRFESDKNSIGKVVKLTYRVEKVLADACNGNPECNKSKLVPLVVSVMLE